MALGRECDVWHVASEEPRRHAPKTFCLASQNEDSLLRIHFRQEAKSLIFATVTLFGTKSNHNNKGQELAARAGTQAGAPFMKKISTALRWEQGAAAEALQK